MNYYFFSGRQPEIALSELEALFGKDCCDRLSDLVIKVDSDLDSIAVAKIFQRIGSSYKVASEIGQCDGNFNNLSSYIIKKLPALINNDPEGKVTIAFSYFGEKSNVSQLQKLGYSLKRELKNKHQRSVRFVESKTAQLNSAQVLRNSLHKPKGWEIDIVVNNHKYLILRTIGEQNIDLYAARDQARPFRDAKVGMLPPKLAQTIINLAQPSINATVLDPFCGTGVLMQETLMMGLTATGSDLEPRMVQYTTSNLKWLKDTFKQATSDFFCEVADATIHQWSDFDVVCAETYLGPPLLSSPDDQKLHDIVSSVNYIHKKFFKNIAQQLKTNQKMCLAVPSWITKNGITTLPCVDQLAEFGLAYNPAISQPFKLYYYRENQFVARHLLPLVKL